MDVSEYLSSFEKDSARLDGIVDALVAVIESMPPADRTYVQDQLAERALKPRHYEIPPSLDIVLTDEERERLLEHKRQKGLLP